MLKNLFSPIEIGKLRIPNRLVVPAMVMNYCNGDGTATEKYVAYHEAKARGGWGLIITEDYAVDPKGKGFSNVPGLWNDGQIESHSKLTRRIHDIGGKIFAQIYHAGRQTSRALIGSEPVAPSPIPCPRLQEIPHALRLNEIRDIVEEFGDCALRARKAGFDGIEIHGAHGYLIAQFMSPYSNKRIDDYGGNILNRMRFPLEIVSNVRSKAGTDFPAIFRISGDEMVPGGRTIEDTKTMAAMLEKAGVDALHISAGVYGSAYAITPPAAVRHGWIAHFAEEVKKVVDLPVITVGRINDPLLAETIIAGGKADLVAMGRASLADPELPKKAAAGRFADINHCIGCLQGCIGMISRGRPATCLVNPTLGKEEEFRIKPATIKKRVFIAGAGPAGMEAARVAGKRGHEVHLFEKADRLGGQFYTASIPPSKGEIAGFIVWQRKQLEENHVSIRLSTQLTEEIVKEQNPDVVVIATGSVPVSPHWPGMKRANVVTAHDALEGKTDVGRSVAVVGGGMVGSETASHLANHGKEVSIVEMLPEIAADVNPRSRPFLLKDLAEHNVKIYVNSAVKEVLADGLRIEREGREEKIGPFDTVILAVGLEPCNGLKSKLEGKVVRLITIGDALSPRKALEAIEEGYRAGLEV
jgi:2,4-dienoyl-CoA reductase-like NADH-dependent reductase (Old Yellow Enzyme family)/thioredoxin reductase